MDAEVYAMAAADLMNVRTLHLQQAYQEEPEVETQEPERANVVARHIFVAGRNRRK